MKTNSVSQILVRQSAFDDDDPTVIVSQNAEFVNSLLFQGGYAPAEIPLNAMRSYHVDYYLGEVANGGHGQFVGNSGWNAPAIRNISDGLRAMNAGPCIEIFEDLRQLIESDAQRARKIADGGGFGEIDPAIKSLDGRFHAEGCYKNVTRANADWLRGLAELRIVADDQYSDVLQALHDANPAREKRLAERKENSLNQALTDPVRVASRLLCVKANCLPVTGNFVGNPSAHSPSGKKTMGWQLHTAKGPRIMFLFDDTALLCESYLGDGSKLTKELMAESRKNLLTGKLDTDAWAYIKNEEIARIDISVVQNAIETAKNFPVVTIAKRLIDKLGDDEFLKDIFAAGTHKSGFLIWMIETNRRIATFAITGGGARLLDLKMNPLAQLSAGEVNQIAKPPTGTDIDVEEENNFLQTCLEKHFKKYSQFGLAFSISTMAALYMFSVRNIILSVILVSVTVYEVIKVRRATQKILTDQMRNVPSVKWLSEQLNFRKLLSFTGIGLLVGIVLLAIGVGINDLFKASVGAVPTVSIYGYNIYISVIITLAIFAALVVGHWLGIRVWARRKVAAWRKGS